MLYFFRAAGSTLWQGSSMLTRKDLKISTELLPGVSGTGVSRRRGGWPSLSRGYDPWSTSLRAVSGGSR